MANPRVSRLKKLQAFALGLIGEGESGWRDEANLSRIQKFAQFWFLVGRGFVRNRCPVRASALAYTTLLALVPLLAIGVSVSASLLKDKGTEPIKKAIDMLVEKVAPQLDLAGDESGTQEVAENISLFISKIRTGALSATATVALIFVAISLLSTIELTFNDIWGVPRGRNWLVRMVQYWAAITLGPILVTVAIGSASGPYLNITKDFLNRAPFLGSFLFQLLPFVILSFVFALFYQFIPNTKVQWQAALTGGLVGALLWQLNSDLNVIYVSQVARNSKMYGGLGLLPVFLIGLYLSWSIILFGAQVSYSFQNRKIYFQERQAERVNQRGREFVALRIMTLIAARFSRLAAPPSAQEMADLLAVPSRLVSRLLEPLQEAKLIVEAGGDEKSYVPARPLETITFENILDALRSGSGRELETKEEPWREIVRANLDRIQKAEQHVASAITLARVVKEETAVPG